MASRAPRMIDECGRHGYGTNEAVIWCDGLADGRESEVEREKERHQTREREREIPDKGARERDTRQGSKRERYQTRERKRDTHSPSLPVGLLQLAFPGITRFRCVIRQTPQ